ncbi:hypothetical protein [Nocardia brasiliensis]|uniref:hypothetical protein n=1 Tax=Nocardia brasiliensis TaxID=37326 RepID=UPI002453C6B6|nr:hypothetical protein [Nocardia brasiliensis]
MNITRGVMVTVWRRGPGGKFGDGGSLVDHEIGPCAMEFGPTDDVDDGPAAGDEFRDADYTDGRLYAPAGSDVLATDVLEVEGVRYRVKGKPAVQRYARSNRPTNLIVRVREVAG